MTHVPDPRPDAPLGRAKSHAHHGSHTRRSPMVRVAIASLHTIFERHPTHTLTEVEARGDPKPRRPEPRERRRPELPCGCGDASLPRGDASLPPSARRLSGGVLSAPSAAPSPPTCRASPPSGSPPRVSPTSRKVSALYPRGPPRRMAGGESVGGSDWTRGESAISRRGHTAPPSG